MKGVRKEAQNTTLSFLSKLKLQHVVGAGCCILGNLMLLLGVGEGLFFSAIGLAYIFAKLPEDDISE